MHENSNSAFIEDIEHPIPNTNQFKLSKISHSRITQIKSSHLNLTARLRIDLSIPAGSLHQSQVYTPTPKRLQTLQQETGLELESVLRFLHPNLSSGSRSCPHLPHPLCFVVFPHNQKATIPAHRKHRPLVVNH